MHRFVDVHVQISISRGWKWREKGESEEQTHKINSQKMQPNSREYKRKVKGNRRERVEDNTLINQTATTTIQN